MLCLRFNCFDYYWIKCYKALKDEKDTWRKNIMKRLLGLLLVLGFVFSSSLYAVAYSEYGYSSVYGVVEDGYNNSLSLELLTLEDDEEPYVNQYCNEEQMGWFDDYLNCTKKFMYMKWGSSFIKIGDEFVMYVDGAASGTTLKDGEKFNFSYDFKESDEYVDKIFDGTVKHFLSDSLSCWEKGWGDGSEVYDFSISKQKSHTLWKKYFKSGLDWEEHSDTILASTVIYSGYSASDPKRASLRDYSCGEFVRYCSTSKPSTSDISFIESERIKNWIYEQRADGIEVLYIKNSIGGPVGSAFLTVSPDDCIRYYKKADIAFSEPYVLGGK
jgi:hypothetical protein